MDAQPPQKAAQPVELGEHVGRRARTRRAPPADDFPRLGRDPEHPLLLCHRVRHRHRAPLQKESELLPQPVELAALDFRDALRVRYIRHIPADAYLVMRLIRIKVIFEAGVERLFPERADARDPAARSRQTPESRLKTFVRRHERNWEL